jgi:ABC-2 type transport system ATP-binding protein
MRALARRLADEGAAVVFSSHDLAEVEEICTMLTIVDRGRVVFSGTVEAMRRLAPGAVRALRTSDNGAALSLAAGRCGVTVTAGDDDDLEVTAGLEALDDYIVALGRAGVAVRSLEHRARSLESLFFELTGHDQPAPLWRGSSIDVAAGQPAAPLGS